MPLHGSFHGLVSAIFCPRPPPDRWDCTFAWVGQDSCTTFSLDTILRFIAPLDRTRLHMDRGITCLLVLASFMFVPFASFFWFWTWIPAFLVRHLHSGFFLSCTGSIPAAILTDSRCHRLGLSCTPPPALRFCPHYPVTHLSFFFFFFALFSWTTRRVLRFSFPHAVLTRSGRLDVHLLSLHLAHTLHFHGLHCLDCLPHQFTPWLPRLIAASGLMTDVSLSFTFHTLDTVSFSLHLLRLHIFLPLDLDSPQFVVCHLHLTPLSHRTSLVRTPVSFHHISWFLAGSYVTHICLIVCCILPLDSTTPAYTSWFLFTFSWTTPTHFTSLHGLFTFAASGPPLIFVSATSLQFAAHAPATSS